MSEQKESSDAKYQQQNTSTQGFKPSKQTYGSRDNAGFSELEYALCTKDHEKARTLISEGYDPRDISRSGTYPMGLSACCENIEAISMLTSYCADFEPPASFLKPPLEFALDLSNNMIGFFLIEHGTDVNSLLLNNETPLLKASLGRNFPMAIALLEAGADYNVRDSDGNSCLSYFTLYGNVKDIVSLSPYFTLRDLIDVLADPTNDISPLKRITFLLHFSASRFKLRSACKEKRLKARTTCLSSALTNSGANETKLSAAKEIDAIVTMTHLNDAINRDIVGCLRRLYSCYGPPPSLEYAAPAVTFYHLISDALISNYGRPKYRDAIQGSNLLHWAIELNLPILARKLLNDVRFSTLLNTSNYTLNRPLHISASLKSHWATSLLLSAGADVNPVNRDGLTPLHIAVISQDVETVKLLVEHNANANLRPRNNSIAEAQLNEALMNNSMISSILQRQKDKGKSCSIFSRNNPLASIVRGRR